MANWMERVFVGTRGQLLTLLRRSRRSINELARELSISDNAVRIHVSALQRDGMVEPAGVERVTGGKPAQLYQTTVEAEELFPKAYAFVLGQVLDALEEEQGRDAMVRVLRRAGERAAGRPLPPGVELEKRVQEAAQTLRAIGGEVTVEKDEQDWTIRGTACPLSGVVSNHEEVCCLAESLVSSIAGAPAKEFCTRGDRPRCAFRISEELPAGAQ